MPRETYVMWGGKLVPKHLAAPLHKSAASPTFMPDIKEFVSPIDGELITSRSKLRAHERRHGVRQAGDFKPGELIAAEKKRIEASKANITGVDFKWI